MRLLAAGLWVESSQLPPIGGHFLWFTLVPLGHGSRPFAQLNPSAVHPTMSKKRFCFCLFFLPWAVSKIENEMSLKSPATNVANFYSLFLVFLIHQCR